MKKEMYPIGARYSGILSLFTKKPAYNIIGIIRTGVKATASCLSATVHPTIRDRAADALKMRIFKPAIKIKTIIHLETIEKSLTY